MPLAMAPGMQQKHRSPRRARRGVTLVEVGAVAALVALVAGGATLWLKPKLDAKRTNLAEKSAEVIRDAAVQWQNDNGSGCPTISQLELDKALPRNASAADPWGNRFRVSCDDSSVTVLSAGRDGRLGTADDVRVPHS